MPKRMHQTPKARYAHDGSRLCRPLQIGLSSSRARIFEAWPPMSQMNVTPIAATATKNNTGPINRDPFTQADNYHHVALNGSKPHRLGRAVGCPVFSTSPTGSRLRPWGSSTAAVMITLAARATTSREATSAVNSYDTCRSCRFRRQAASTRRGRSPVQGRIRRSPVETVGRAANNTVISGGCGAGEAAKIRSAYIWVSEFGVRGR